VPLNIWWMDAGWYPPGIWPKTGTWEPDPTRFPHGFRPISDAVHARGGRLLVWFEPERVTAGSWLHREHPEWLLGPPGKDLLLDLGNPAALKWLTEHVGAMIQREGLDIYRQDFNFEPLPRWQFQEAEDRQGIREIRHVEGYLAYFDALLQRFPKLLIDTCASGGQRLDLETLRRAVPLWRSDHPFDIPSQQQQTYGLSMWVPFHGTATNSSDPYRFRSQMTPGLSVGVEPGWTEAEYARWRALVAQWKGFADLYYADYYPVTACDRADTTFLAWQFNSPEKGAGFIQAFRRAESAFETARLRLRGLDAKRHYEFTDVDTGAVSKFTGAELMDQGLSVTVAERPAARVVRYRAVD
jgi:alpha-galactosidase